MLRCCSVSSFRSMTTNTRIVTTIPQAKEVLELLMERDVSKGFIHAADTEVVGFDSLKSPINNGKVICCSIYSGPDVDYNSGSRIFIDNCDESEGTLDILKPFFESNDHLKIWHNYSFDKHELGNHGISCSGFAGDTMHMARLWDASRALKGGYSLENLTDELYIRKKPMKELFGKKKKLKSGGDGKSVVMPDILTLHRDPEFRNDWIEYSAFDAESTWHLYKELEKKLLAMKWGEGLKNGKAETMMDFYERYWKPFGELLTDMEKEGIKVDVKNYLPLVEKQALLDKDEHEKFFINWATKYSPEAKYMNINSDAQKQAFLFAPCYNNIDRGNKKLKEDEVRFLPKINSFNRPNTEGLILEGKKKALKDTTFQLDGLGIKPSAFTKGGWPQVSSEVILKLCGNPAKKNYGTLINFFETKQEGEEACEALFSLNSVSSIETMLNTFIIPLQTQVDSNSRVHCNMNLNTETGRLSARRPNLQNQPALEKDIYKVRSAFQSEEGKSLLVADYGQLELRVLAHMTRCESMIEAFKLGGDFHSRTALGMFEYIKTAIENKECYLEWDEKDGERDRPLLKDKYSAERRKAKILNFSIAYGKTPHGLKEDFGVSLKEAQETVDLWYRDRPEVRLWQQNVIKRAKKAGYTRTLMGRYRNLRGINDLNRALSNHSARAAINTPIQGGAADIVMMAMLKIANNKRLKELGWKMLLQIHDEVILEGPEESGPEAQQLLIYDMENPFDSKLLVDLKVDSKIAKTWYDAK